MVLEANIILYFIMEVDMFYFALLYRYGLISIITHFNGNSVFTFTGMVAASSSPAHEANHNFVNVEFDDGDSGKIHVDDIRLLPPEFPVLGKCMYEMLLTQLLDISFNLFSFLFFNIFAIKSVYS